MLVNKSCVKKLLPILILFSIVIGGCKKSETQKAIEGAVKPVITGITPSVVTTGTVVSVTGSNFGTSGDGLSVFFNGKQATIQSVTPTKMEVVVPETTSGNLSLQAGSETVSGPPFTFINQGQISSVLPGSGSPGTLVRINGNSFGSFGPVAVTFNGKAAEVKSATATAITVVVPDTTSGNVVVTSGNFAVQGPVFNIYGPAKITSISPDTAISGMVATLTGVNFGNTTSGVSVSFNNKTAIVQSVSPTEIKVIIPPTTTGKVNLTVNGQVTEGPIFFYGSQFNRPYTGGNIQLSSQADVDAFAAQNKGGNLQITGNLSIDGTDITSVAGLSNITSISGILTVSGTQISDPYFLNNITAVGGLTLRGLPISSVVMDKLTTSTGLVMLAACPNLRSASFKMLSTTTGGNVLLGSLTVTGCQQLANLDLKQLSSTTYRITVTGTALADLNAFSSLKSAGALTISGNSNMLSLHGLENLTQLTMYAFGSSINAFSSTINGLTITGNAKLSSLNGMQNLSVVPIASITYNASLNDLCPAKSWLNNLANLPDYSYKTQSLSGIFTTTPKPALILTDNGSYTTRADALAALALCR